MCFYFIGSRTPSAKKSRIKSSKSKSKASSTSIEQNDSAEIKHEERNYQFLGYNLGDNLLHISGEQSFIFPSDGALIRVDKTSFIQQSTQVTTTVFRKGDMFSIHFKNPKMDGEENEKELNVHNKSATGKRYNILFVS